MGANEAKFNSGVIGTGRGTSAGRAGTGGALRSGCLGTATAAFEMRTAGDSIFGGAIGTTVLVSSRFGKRISTGIFNWGGDAAC